MNLSLEKLPIMSGHSKWSKVKHQKATTDVLKAAAFTKASRAITIAVREGGGIADPNRNFRLRLAIEKAKDVNMPKENILRAIEKGKGEGSASLSSVVYEGYGPFGVAMLIAGVTDNVNRTVSFVKQVLEHNGGRLASPGAVSYLFSQRGLLTVPKPYNGNALMEHAIEAGADDILEMDDLFEIYTEPQKLSHVKQAFEDESIPVETCTLLMHPSSIIALSPEQRKTIEALIEKLVLLDDISEVYTNMA